MPVNIVENFQLGTDLPLDARYIVSDPYDVSLYWYPGMQMYEPSTNKIWVVRDVSNAIVEPLLYEFDYINGGTYWSNPTNDYLNGGNW